MIKKLISSIVPEETKASRRNHKILSDEYGQGATIKHWECMDALGNPIPWYTYPAIEYLNQLDFSRKKVFEFGSGNSTRFWASISKHVVAVEDDKEWHSKIKPLLPGNVDYLFESDRDAYIHSILSQPEDFDVIIVDGSHRYECAEAALRKLRDDGFVILDNSDWKEKTSSLLRDADLIEVDMSGFGPINPYTWTTSFYFRRGVKLSPRHDRQPVHGIGSIPHREE